MLDLAHLNNRNFTQQFLKFRIRYYLNETKEFLARHKLLTVFLICLLAPGVQNITALGIPFYALVAPAYPFKVKLIYLISVLLLLLAVTKIQWLSIKGGSFREYLHTLYLPNRIHKKIDFIVLVLSLNGIWLAIFFGGISILHGTSDSLFRLSQYWLYGAAILAIITFLFTCLYRNIAHAMVLFFSLCLVVFISKQGSWLLNYGIGAAVYCLSTAIIWAVQPYARQRNAAVHMDWFKNLLGFSYFVSLNKIFLIQVAVYRKYKASFFIRFILCFMFSALVLSVLSSANTEANQEGIMLILISVQVYILSTLFTLFEQEKLKYAVFHEIFPYQRFTQYMKETALVGSLLITILFPVVWYCTFSLPGHVLWLLIILAINGLVLVINRVFYAQSLRFCLFTSWLSSMGGAGIQYVMTGAYFG